MENDITKKLIDEVGKLLELHTPKVQNQYKHGDWANAVENSLDRLHRLHYQISNPFKPRRQE